MKQLREKAKIEYMGDFAKTDPAAAATPASAPQTRVGRCAFSAPAVGKPPDKTLEKGISGLK